MAKLSRIVGRIFGSNSGGSQVAVFGSLFAGAPAFSVNPATVQSLSNWLDGWFSAAIDGNAPAIEDMNAFCYVLSYQMAYLLQQGVPEWNSATTYYSGSIAMSAGVLYVSQADTNLNHAVSDETWWRPYGSASGMRIITGTTNVLATDKYLFGNAGAGGFAVIFPVTTDYPGLAITIKKTDSSDNAITYQATGGVDTFDGVYSSGVMSIPNQSQTFVSDGNGRWNLV